MNKIWIVEEHFIYSSITRRAFTSKEKAQDYILSIPNIQYSLMQDLYFTEKDADGSDFKAYYIIRELEVL